MELTNIHKDVADQLYKLASVSLCSNVEGQIMVSLTWPELRMRAGSSDYIGFEGVLHG